jgi:small-conductance mechanosensitive channel
METFFSPNYLTQIKENVYIFFLSIKPKERRLMKIIEALKKIKDNERKLDDLIQKVKLYSADMDYETPVYQDQRGQINSWLQCYEDIVKDIEMLRFLLQKTNIQTQVTINLDGKDITKSIAQWIQRRKELAKREKMVYDALTDRNLRDLKVQQSAGQIVDAKVRRYYDPLVKDKKTSALASEPSIIDSKLETINAITDLAE